MDRQEALRLLEVAIAKRDRQEEWVGRCVAAARQAGLSWREIGDVLGITGEGVRKRYRPG